MRRLSARVSVFLLEPFRVPDRAGRPADMVLGQTFARRIQRYEYVVSGSENEIATPMLRYSVVRGVVDVGRSRPTA